jgi:DNA polymerase elongation subunit (family B)
MNDNAFIYGSDPTERVTSIEVRGDELHVFREGLPTEVRPYQYWALSPTQFNDSWRPLEGNNHYRFIRYYDSREDLMQDKDRHPELYVVWDNKDATLLSTGITYFKGMRLQDVSVLAFDIESTGIEHGRDSRVLLISNTFRRGAHVERKLFAYDDYSTDAEMFDDWCAWVRERNPSLVVGHNIYGYDLPYLSHCARRAGTELRLGRDGSRLYIPQYESKYRRDGSQFYTYNNAKIFGREIVDTFFLAMKYDFSRKYESYGLKQIIKQEGLEIEGRQHYDASLISRNYQNAAEWLKIKRYAEHDADDALALFDRMVSAYFYLNQSIPCSFQNIVNTASGRWLNSFLVRSYLQINHSIPAPSDATEYEGAISIGNPGTYRNVFKVDVASLYPSIMLQYEIHDSTKDPRGHFQQMVQHFTAERLANKKRAKETGDRYYSDLEQAQKIVINSAYGMLGTPGLPFNSPTKAAFVTQQGREILDNAMDFANGLNMQLVNADTDSISVTQNGTEWSEAFKQYFLTELNRRSPERIRWEDDGLYDAVLVLKAKNYALKQGEKIKIKGSALKASLKEKALKEFIDAFIRRLLEGASEDCLRGIYDSYAREIVNLQDISRWSFKKTITDSVINPSRTNEEKVLNALEGEDVQMGDKRYFYFDVNDNLKLQENWRQDHNVDRLLEKLFKTVKVFETVINVKNFHNYKLKKHKSLLLQLLKQSA